jgi:hypothetical protein
VITLPETGVLIASLLSTTCPACGQPKRRRNTLCVSCYRRLPPLMQRNLYHRLGAGYAEAVAAAFARLGVETFTPPPRRPDRPRGLFDDAPTA